MGFRNKILPDYKIGLLLFVVFFLFYFFMNFKVVEYLSDFYEDILLFSPFANYSLFLLNLFNFDPSMYKHDMSPVHPFKVFLTIPIDFIGGILGLDSPIGKNVTFLIIQSSINSLSTVLIYFIFKLLKLDKVTSILLASLFGISSYNIITSFVPDSYVYAQCLIIISILFLFKFDITKKQTSILGTINFGITSTNLIPYLVGVFINLVERVGLKHSLKKFIVYTFYLIGLCLFITLIQYLIWDKTWAHNLLEGVEKGGFSYTETFSFEKHWYSMYLLFINPIIFPNIELIDMYLMAFVSKWEENLFLKIVPLFLGCILLITIYKNYKRKELWILLGYLGFNAFLHIIVGFGLATIKYDLFLYAGHYLAVLFLILGLFISSLPKKGLYISKYILVISLFILLVNNIVKYTDFYGEMLASYDTMNSEQIELNSSQNWEFFSSKENYKIIRVNLNLQDKLYLVLNNDLKLKNSNADYFFEPNLSDIYPNGYLYISVSNQDSGWEENYVPSSEEIALYIDLNNYKLIYNAEN